MAQIISRQFNNGDTCTISATPVSHYTFSGWYENNTLVSSDNPYTFTVSGSRTLEGKFTADSYVITTVSDPISGGNITGGGTYDYGDTCTVEATENPHFSFVTWVDGDGNFLSNSNPYSFTVTGSITVKAVFDTNTVTVVSDHGTVTGAGNYSLGDTCTLEATPSTGYIFDHWEVSGVSVSTSNPYSFTVSGDVTVSAIYTAVTFTISCSTDGNGTVSGTGTYLQGTTCTLTATPNTHYQFVSFTENGNVVSSTNPYSFTVTADRTLDCSFNAITPLRVTTSAPVTIQMKSIWNNQTRGWNLTTGVNEYYGDVQDFALDEITTIFHGGLTGGENILTIDASPLSSMQTLTTATGQGGAFDGCSNLTSVVLPNSLITIDQYAFTGCTSLTSITANSLEHINGFAFNGCVGLTSLTLPNSLLSIGQNAFRNCSYLSSISVGNSLTSIGSNAFYGCSALTSITLPSTLTSIGANAFDSSGLTSITIPNSVTSLGNYAFWECDDLATVVIGNSLTTIGDSTFVNCDSLTSVTLGNSVTTIGPSVFYDCDALTSITIPNSLTTLGASSFRSSGLLSIDLSGTSVTSIPNYCFAYSDLSSVTLPSALTSIGNDAFHNTNLTSITIPDSVTTIGNNAFRNCDSLASSPITIPANVTSIGDYAFYDCSLIDSFICEPTTPPTVGTQALGGSGPIYVPYSADHSVYNSYVSSWSTYSSRIVETSAPIPSALTVTASGSAVVPLYNSNNDPDTYYWNVSSGTNTYDGSEPGFALNEIQRISRITTGKEYILTIDASALTSWTATPYAGFSGCSALTSITLPSTVTSIGVESFYGCSSLTSIDLSNVTTINSSVFQNCTSLASVTFGNSLTSLGNYAFRGCTALTSITLPNSLTTLNVGIFLNCSNLASVTLGNAVTTISGSGFRYCTSLTSITLPSTLTTLGATVFQGSGLTSITIPANVSSLGNQCFENCTGLTSITCQATTPPTIGTDVFNNTNDCPIYVPTASLSAYQTSWSTYATRLQGI